MKNAPDSQGDVYDIQFLKSKLSQLGYALMYVPRTPTTMSVILQKAANDPVSMHLVLTDHQTNGVGRQNRQWLDTPYSSLMFSAVFKIKQENIAIFADLVALAVSDALKNTTACPVKIKYPNDLTVNDQKVGGILLKNLYDDDMNYLGTSVGVGINVHYDKKQLAKFPTDYPATSLDLASGESVSRQELLLSIAENLKFIATETNILHANPSLKASYDKAWRDASSMKDRKIAILKHDKIIESGIVIDTQVGRGIKLQGNKGEKWFSLFGQDFKARFL